MSPSRVRRSRARLVERAYESGLSPSDRARWDQMNATAEPESLDEALSAYGDERDMEALLILL